MFRLVPTTCPSLIPVSPSRLPSTRLTILLLVRVPIWFSRYENPHCIFKLIGLKFYCKIYIGIHLCCTVGSGRDASTTSDQGPIPPQRNVHTGSQYDYSVLRTSPAVGGNDPAFQWSGVFQDYGILLESRSPTAATTAAAATTDSSTAPPTPTTPSATSAATV